ncbi:peptidoglycan DD-metalloendopeptidase family protein [Aestuariivivens sp. NBU2969]|uniref:peptidoglycan DD-metalloendopeptidase family protein n=1 Tax=Aestuariivivens sp. NBU2969 TaxID=2873267 RepID=UPI001CBFFA4D|nr:peptidoglycan DD-metalloendopeptidase family protein [Aestuariivivens sp. NBU2969]
MDSSRFLKCLSNISTKPLHVLDASKSYSKYIPLDLSANSAQFSSFYFSSSEKLGNYIGTFIKMHKAFAAYGGYLEKRTIYKRSTHFNTLNLDNSERNIHLGIDFWCPVNTAVYTPLKATVHSFCNNSNYGDYGPTIILKHTLFEFEFYTLYGHLSLSSIKHLKVGQVFKAGDQIGSLGSMGENGDYPPHLHFQIIKNLQGWVGDYPGVCNIKDLSFFKSNCPDPNLLLKINCSVKDKI